MKLIALLSWYEEPESWLAELVASMARAGIDHVVAVDGAYFLYPRGRARSSSGQADVIARTAAGAGMGFTIHAPDQPWFGNEVEKRDFLFRAGHLVGQPGVDWLWICDGDEVITDAIDVKARLAETEHDVGEVILWTRKSPDAEIEHFPIRKLFRVQPGGIRVEANHFTYIRAEDGAVLWHGNGGDSVPYRGRPSEPMADFWSVRVEHRVTERGRARVADKDAYVERRDRLQIEELGA